MKASIIFILCLLILPPMVGMQSNPDGTIYIWHDLDGDGQGDVRGIYVVIDGKLTLCEGEDAWIEDVLKNPVVRQEYGDNE